MVFDDPKCGNIYFNYSNVCEVASGLQNPERPAQLDRVLVFRKLNTVYRPFFALISHALENTENVAIVMYNCFVCLLTFRSGWLED